MTPQQAAVIRDTERERLTSIIDKRIKAWEQFQKEFPDHPGLDVLLAELDYIRSLVYDSTTKQHIRR